MKRSYWFWIAGAFALAVTALALGTTAVRGGFANRPIIKMSTREARGVVRAPILPIELSNGRAAHLVIRLYDEAGNEIDGYWIPADGDRPSWEAKEITVTVGVTQGNAPVIGTEVQLYPVAGAFRFASGHVWGDVLSQPTDVDGLARFKMRIERVNNGPADGGRYELAAADVRNAGGRPQSRRVTLIVKQ